MERTMRIEETEYYTISLTVYETISLESLPTGAQNLAIPTILFNRSRRLKGIEDKWETGAVKGVGKFTTNF